MGIFVYLCGPTGSGKTRLLKNIESLSGSYLGTQVLRVNTELLVNEMVRSLRLGAIESFRRKYLESGDLLVDNLWVLKGKVHTTREIFNLFATVIEHERMIVAAGDLPPAAIAQGVREAEAVFRAGLIVNLA